VETWIGVQFEVKTLIIVQFKVETCPNIQFEVESWTPVQFEVEMHGLLLADPLLLPCIWKVDHRNVVADSNDGAMHAHR